MKALAGVMIVLAILIGVIPLFSDCESQGRMLTLENGRQVSMKCHWTARAELGLALPMLTVGGLMGFSNRRESRRVLGIGGIALGALAVLFPTALIGVCSNPEMVCNSLMRPALIFLGSIAILLSLGVAIFPSRKGDVIA